MASVPIAVNVLQHPLPTARRCYKLGQAIRHAVESYERDVRVAIIGTGGMSHQLTGKNFGQMHRDNDMDFLDRIERDPESLTQLSTWYRSITASGVSQNRGIGGGRWPRVISTRDNARFANNQGRTDARIPDTAGRNA